MQISYFIERRSFADIDRLPILDWHLLYDRYVLSTKGGKFTGDFYGYVYISVVLFRYKLSVDVIFGKGSMSPEKALALHRKRKLLNPS